MARAQGAVGKADDGDRFRAPKELADGIRLGK